MPIQTPSCLSPYRDRSDRRKCDVEVGKLTEPKPDPKTPAPASKVGYSKTPAAAPKIATTITLEQSLSARNLSAEPSGPSSNQRSN